MSKINRGISNYRLSKILKSLHWPQHKTLPRYFRMSMFYHKYYGQLSEPDPLKLELRCLLPIASLDSSFESLLWSGEEQFSEAYHLQ
jgi:hypothetical protein